MKKILVASLALVLGFGASASVAKAEEGAQAAGLIGTRHIAVSYGSTMPGNDVLKDVDDSVMEIEAQGNVPVFKNLDVFVVLGYSETEGRLRNETLTSDSQTKRAEAGLAYQFFPGGAFNPFVRGTVGYSSMEYDNTNKKSTAPPQFPKADADTVSDVAYSVGLGLEIPFAGQFSGSPSVSYRKVGDVQDEFLVGVDVNGWFNKVLFAGASLTYGSDEGDLRYMTTLGFGF